MSDLAYYYTLVRVPRYWVIIIIIMPTIANIMKINPEIIAYPVRPSLNRKRIRDESYRYIPRTVLRKFIIIVSRRFRRVYDAAGIIFEISVPHACNILAVLVGSIK